MPKVLIGAGPLRGKPGVFRDLLHRSGFETIDPPGDDTLTEAVLRETLPGCEAIIAGGEPISRELMSLVPGLRGIARTGVGYDAVDIAAASQRRIVVTITPGANHDAVAEQAFALLLALTRRVPENDRIIRSGGWDRTLPSPLRGSTLGLIGLGRIGRAMVPKALAFGMRVIGYDPLADPVFDTQHGIHRLPIEHLLAESDVVSLHLPLTEVTRNLIDRDRLLLMRRGSWLINTSRGGLIDEAALFEAIQSGHLAGAGLDVLNFEPPEPNNPLLTLPNVVVSPHIAGIDTQSMADMAELAARCIIDLNQGRWPSACVVNHEVQQDWKW